MDIKVGFQPTMTLHTLDVCNSVDEGYILEIAIKGICIHNLGELFHMPPTELVPLPQRGAPCARQATLRPWSL